MRLHLFLVSSSWLLLASLTTIAAPPDGWTSLFNGTDLAGWTVKARPTDRAKGFWKVTDGAIVADSIGAKGHDYVWLCTDQEYDNFILRLRFQAFRSSPGNSGVQIRSRYDDKSRWLDGPQIDIHPPGPWRTGMIWDETRGSKRWLYPVVPAGKWVKPDQAKPGIHMVYSDDTPAWNSLEITANGTHLKAVLNEVVVMDYDGRGVLDDPVHQQRRVGMKGIIALQIHRGDQLKMRFKDIYLKQLEIPGPAGKGDRQ